MCHPTQSGDNEAHDDMRSTCTFFFNLFVALMFTCFCCLFLPTRNVTRVSVFKASICDAPTTQFQETLNNLWFRQDRHCRQLDHQMTR